jgi:hypothetical protein
MNFAQLASPPAAAKGRSLEVTVPYDVLHEAIRASNYVINGGVEILRSQGYRVGFYGMRNAMRRLGYKPRYEYSGGNRLAHMPKKDVKPPPEKRMFIRKNGRSISVPLSILKTAYNVHPNDYGLIRLYIKKRGFILSEEELEKFYGSEKRITNGWEASPRIFRQYFGTDFVGVELLTENGRCDGVKQVRKIERVGGEDIYLFADTRVFGFRKFRQFVKGIYAACLNDRKPLSALRVILLNEKCLFSIKDLRDLVISLGFEPFDDKSKKVSRHIEDSTLLPYDLKDTIDDLLDT